MNSLALLSLLSVSFAKEFVHTPHREPTIRRANTMDVQYLRRIMLNSSGTFNQFKTFGNPEWISNRANHDIIQEWIALDKGEMAGGILIFDKDPHFSMML